MKLILQKNAKFSSTGGSAPKAPVPPKFESGSQKRKRKEEKRTKSKEVESRCKKISQFFPNVDEQ